MNWSCLRIWLIATFTIAITGIAIRAIWQIVAIPTPDTMLIFIPLTVSLLGVNVFFAYLIFNPQKLKSLPFIIGITAALTAGLIAGVTHFVRFIISPEAEPALSKIVSSFILLSSVSAYLLILRLIWPFRKRGKE